MSKTVRLTVGQAITKFLINQWSERDGVERRLISRVAGIFGHGNLSGIGQGVYECGEGIPFHQPFHEQSMVHMAVAFARRNRRLSTMMCTASVGPGTANMFTGAAGATIQRVPVFLLAGDHYGSRRQGVVLQQLEHATNFDYSVADGLRTVSAFYDKIVRPEQIIGSLPEAMRVLSSPSETGAVTLSVCQDTQCEAADFPVELFEKRVWHVERRPSEASQIERVVEMLAKASKPVIISGGGVYYSEAEQELRNFAETFGIPVLETVAGRSTMAGESPMAMGAMGIAGNFAANEVANQADLVLSIGTRLTDVATCSQTLFQNPNVRFASINVAGRDAIKLGAVSVLADARAGLEALSRKARERDIRPNEAWSSQAVAAVKQWNDIADPTLVSEEGKPMTQAQALAIVNGQAKPESYVVAAAGSLPGDVNKLWDTKDGKLVHLEFGFSCMTYEIPAGIGLVMAGESNVYVCIGDGTYLMNPSDLLVAARERLKLTVCVFVNRGYQIIRGLQELTTAASFATEFRAQDNQGGMKGPYLDIDIAQNAASLGATVHSASTPDELKAALGLANASSGLNVIVIDVDPHAVSVGTKHSFWDIAPPQISANADTQKVRDAYDDRRAALQRHYL